MPHMSSDLASFQQCLCSSRRILALASSGLPTFRGAGGLWRGYDATELATPEAFTADPSLVWQFYSFRRQAALRAKPNNGHYALAELARRKDFVCLTQNVDGLSSRAHHPSDRLLHLHGDLFRLKCTSFMCNYTEENFDPALTPALADVHMDHLQEIPKSDLPKCPRCGGLLRPGVVWFGEPLPLDVMDKADHFISKGVDLILVIGTSGSVWPAAGYVEQVAMAGGKVAVFNVADTDTSQFGGWFFQGDAAKLLPEALEPVIGTNYKK